MLVEQLNYLYIFREKYQFREIIFNINCTKGNHKENGITVRRRKLQ